MLCWILAIYDVDAVHFCERKVQYVYSNLYECSRPNMKPGTVSMLRILNWALKRENHSFRPPFCDKAYICGNRMGDMGLG